MAWSGFKNGDITLWHRFFDMWLLSETRKIFADELLWNGMMEGGI